MTIPVFRHNQHHDDWEVASVYNSDDCDSMGRSAYGESVHSSAAVDGPAMHMQGRLYQDARPVARYSVPQSQHQNYPPAYPRPRRDVRYAVPGKPSNFVVPPPGVIFPSKEWALPPSPPPQNTYWPSAPSQMAPSSERPMDAGLIETPSPPPPPSLLLSPSSPPCATSPLIPPHAAPVTGKNVNTHAPAMVPPPPRYHEVAPNNTHTISSRLAEAGRQAHSGMGMSPPRRSRHDVLSTTPPYTGGPGPGRPSMEMPVVDGRYGTLPPGGAGYGSCDRSDLHPKHEYEGYGCEVRTAMPQMRERRPSIWRRFARRFNPHVSVGQT